MSIYSQPPLAAPAAGFHRLDLAYLRELVKNHQLSAAVAHRLISYWSLRLADSHDLIYRDYFEYYLFFESVNAGIITALIYEPSSRRILHQYGILGDAIPHILKSMQQAEHFPGSQENEATVTNFSFGQENFQLWQNSIVFEKNRYLLAILYPQKRDLGQQLARLQNVFLRYYLPDIFQPDSRFLPLFDRMDNLCTGMANQFLQQNRPVTYTFLRFEQYRKYIELAGEYFAGALVKEIRNNIRRTLNNDDSHMVLSLDPHRFLVVSFDRRREDLQKSFHRVAFKIKGLLLNYKIQMTTYYHPIESMSEIWSEIVIME